MGGFLLVKLLVKVHMLFITFAYITSNCYICGIGIDHCDLLQCLLWGFNGGEIDWGNPYETIHVNNVSPSKFRCFKNNYGHTMGNCFGFHKLQNFLKPKSMPLSY
jgi:hypothetical protein